MTSRVQIGCAGGAPSNNFIWSLRDSERADRLVGMSSSPSDLLLADVDEKYVVPSAVDSCYPAALLKLLGRVRPTFLHSQNDFEIRAISRLRDSITSIGTLLYLPEADVVEMCVDKYRTWQRWSADGLIVPDTILLRSPEDLTTAADRCGLPLWVRAVEGGGGRGAVPTSDLEFARRWIDRYEGWGQFTASTCLSKDTVTWSSIWFEGELVVAQTRRRRQWSFGDRTLSGVTGITGVGETCSDSIVDRVALDAIASVDPRPHGIFSVDMTYDGSGHPNPTEINIGRFFTTHYFFTRAGLNLPEIYCSIAIDGTFPSLARKMNPLPDGLIWVRGMDRPPVLSTAAHLAAMFEGSEGTEGTDCR
jgi:hypothetical protein